MDAIDHLLSRGVDTIYPNKKALEDMLRSGKKLRLYQGFDPTGPHLHIGHAVALRKLREFQDLGHEVIFLIGDITATIGDPSGKLSSRKVLTREEVLENAKTYKEQASKILLFDGKSAAHVKYNSEWLAPMTAREFISLSYLVSVQQIVERDMFQKRIAQEQDVFMNEFMYPLLQAYDSVAMDVDLELGGTDQMFNMMMGRRLMKKMKNKEKFVMTVPLLTDAAGNKIGKSEGNVIGLTDPPNDFFAKIMSLGDDAILPCFTLLTDLTQEEIERVKKAMEQGENPMTHKKQLAFILTKWLHSNSDAHTAQEQFEHRVQQKDYAKSDLPVKLLTTISGETITEQLISLGLTESKSDAKRLIAQGSVSLNNTKITDHSTLVAFRPHDILVVGKKAIRIGENP